MRQLLSLVIYGSSGLVGVIAFTYPFFLPQLDRISGDQLAGAGQDAAPLLTLVLLILCLGVLFLDLQGQVVNAKRVAALGILIAVAAALRFLEVAIPGPGGFSPMFVPILLAGYVFGARFGFLMGALTMLASALITGGVGPWLPYQMYAAGWLGLTVGWLPHPQQPGRALLLLAGAGFVWGILFGLIMNLFFWPFLSGNAAMSWEPGLGLAAAIGRYGAFYLATSFWWDLIRAVGNVLLLLALGRPALQALYRFRRRFEFEWVAA